MNDSSEEAKPRVFIGSSSEGLGIAKLIEQGLSYDAHCFLWTDSRIFGASEHVMESLERALEECTYAVIVLSPDDMGESRGESYFMPRDNLLFEMGLFAGRHGRKSVFMVIPRGMPIKIPSDLQGINACEYKTLKDPDRPPTYHVTTACTQISEVLKKHRPPGRQARPVADSFWKSLADRVLIVYGVEHNPHSNPKGHPRMSPRDLETAHLIFGFLNRYYPEKTVRLCPAREPKWEGDLTRESDLILIGGFVTNEMYKIYRSTYEKEFEQNLRLKMGRLCRVEERRVYHLGFEESAGYIPRSEPLELENIPSEFVTRDYGIVTSRTALFYENNRRIITISGVKGNGTKAAAMALTKLSQQIPDLDKLLPSHFSGNDSFEMVVEAKVTHNTIASLSAVEILLNNKQLNISAEGDGTPCELDTACAGCKFGLLDDPDAVPAGIYPHIPQLRGIKAIIFDLDDTLVDTSRYLIDRLEDDAAQMMFKAGISDTDKAEIHEILMQLRMAYPDNIEEMLVKRLPQTTMKAIRARRRVLAKAPSMVEQLRMNPEVINLLERLAKTYKLYLVTAGDYAYQTQKIKHLDYEYHLRHYFAEDPVKGIVDAGSTESKEQKMLSLIKGNFSRNSVVVVGNRWDHEIRAGKKLGLRTICVRHGEGSSLVPANDANDPDHLIVDNILELSNIL